MSGRWDWSGPEEGDTIDRAVIVTFDFDEVIEIKAGNLRQRKATAAKLAKLLNEADAEIMK